MANTRKSSPKSLKMTDIKSVDESGKIVADAMQEIAAEERLTVSAEPKERKPLATVMLELGATGKVIANTYAPYPGYGTAFSFGVLKGAHKWHIYEHSQIMGVLNGIGSMRLGHYKVVEEGLHLKHTFDDVMREKIYEGTFGYVCFEKAPAEWLAEFEKRGIQPNAGHYGDWMKLIIKNQRVTFGHWINPVSLKDVAEKLETTVEKLSPITRKNNEQEWNTWYKRYGVEAALRASRGETHIVAALKEVKGKPLTGREWAIGVETGRFGKLYGPIADLAKAMGDAAASGDAQVAADQEGFLTKSPSTAQAAEEWAAQVGQLVLYKGETFTPAQLVRANVATMKGDFEVVASLYLRDLSMVKKQWEDAVAGKMTFRVNRLAQ